jgi:cadmium resistance protein CadD (predicted permease)
MKKFIKYFSLIVLLFVVIVATKTSQILIEKHYVITMNEIAIKQFEGNDNYSLMLNAIAQEKRVVQTLVSLVCFMSFVLILVLIASSIAKDLKE